MSDAGNMRKGFVLGEDVQKPETSSETMKAGFILEDSKIEMTPAVMKTDDVATTIGLEEDPEEQPEKTKFWTSPVLWVILLITGLGGLQCYYFISEAFAQNTAVGLLSSAVMSALLVMASWSVWKELRSVLLLKRSDERREQIRHAVASGTVKDAVMLCEEMARDSGMLKSRQYESFKNKISDHFSPEEVFALYECEIIRTQDEKARKIIVKRSRENGIVVALSPMAWLDMLFTLARSVRMIREISEVYGLRCGIWGRMNLYRRVAKNIVYIGMADLATDAVTDVLGAGMAGKISSALGQGIAAGIYSTRLGYMSIKAVRPMDLNRKVLTLSELRKSLLTEGKFSEIIRGEKDRK